MISNTFYIYLISVSAIEVHIIGHILVYYYDGGDGMKSLYIKRIETDGLLAYMDEVNMPERDKEIVKLYANGNTSYKKIAEQYDISGERVRQLIEKYARKEF